MARYSKKTPAKHKAKKPLTWKKGIGGYITRRVDNIVNGVRKHPKRKK